MPEKKSSVDRVVETTNVKDKSKAYTGLGRFFEDEFKGKFDSQEKLSGERAKTEFEEVFIEAILSKMPEFLQEQGLKKYLPINKSHIHFIDEKSLTAEERRGIFDTKDKSLEMDESILGRWAPDLQSIIMFSPEENNFKILVCVIHEIMHAQSFHSVETIDFSLRSKLKGEKGYIYF